jgi:hypothetical protein
MAAVLAQELIQLDPLYRHCLHRNVHRIDQEDYLHWRLLRFRVFFRGFKRFDLLRLFAVEKGEILLLQPRNRIPGLVGHHRIEPNAMICGRMLLGGWSRWGLLGGRCRGLCET